MFQKPQEINVNRKGQSLFRKGSGSRYLLGTSQIFRKVVTQWIRANCPVIVLRVPVWFCVALTFLTGVTGFEGAPGHLLGAGYVSVVQTANTCWMTWWRLAAALPGFALGLLMKNQNWSSLVLRDDEWTNVSSSDWSQIQVMPHNIVMCSEMLSQPRTSATGALEGGTLGGKQSKSSWDRRLGDHLPEWNGLVVAESNSLPAPANVIKDFFFMILLSIWSCL